MQELLTVAKVIYIISIFISINCQIFSNNKINFKELKKVTKNKKLIKFIESFESENNELKKSLLYLKIELLIVIVLTL